MTMVASGGGVVARECLRKRAGCIYDVQLFRDSDRLRARAFGVVVDAVWGRCAYSSGEIGVFGICFSFSLRSGVGKM